MAKKKLKSVAALYNDAAVLIQKIRRMEEAEYSGQCQCVTCHNWYHWKQMQGGHFIPRQHKRWKLARRNIHPQCARCNGPLGGNLIPYTLFMQEKYGVEYVAMMESTKHDSTGMLCRADLIALIKRLSAEALELERNVN